MSYDIFYTLHTNKKSYFYAKTLFFGKQKFYDYKKIVDDIFDNFDKALEKAIELDLSNFIIRKNISTSSGLSTKDYKYKNNRLKLR